MIQSSKPHHATLSSSHNIIITCHHATPLSPIVTTQHHCHDTTLSLPHNNHATPLSPIVTHCHPLLPSNTIVTTQHHCHYTTLSSPRNTIVTTQHHHHSLPCNTIVTTQHHHPMLIMHQSVYHSRKFGYTKIYKIKLSLSQMVSYEWGRLLTRALGVAISDDDLKSYVGFVPEERHQEAYISKAVEDEQVRWRNSVLIAH